MKSRHWVTIVCIALAALIVYAKTNGAAVDAPRWLWDGAFWALLFVALVVILRGAFGRSRR